MPYKSDAQRRYFNWAAKHGKIDKKTVDHWNSESKGMNLPDKISKEDVHYSEESPPGWKGTVRAMLAHHPEKFSKEACDKDSKSGKLCPYAVAWSDEEKGGEAHYKDQKSSLKGEPKKKEKFKEWLSQQGEWKISLRDS